MNWLAFLVILCLCLVALTLVAAVSRHKKSATGAIRLLGARALSQSSLSPEGAILVNGELWRARSIDGSNIPAHTKVQVVELQGHLLVVARDD